MDAIITVDESHHIVLYNRAAEQIFAWPRDAVLGQPLEKLIPTRFRNGHGAHMQRFGQTGVTSRRMGARNVVHGLRADGTEFPLDASISQLDTPGRKLFTVILRDATERVKAQRDRSAFAVAALTIREEEKARVARELHDELAQSLAALKMDVIWVRDHAVATPQGVQHKLTEMLSMLDQAVAATRRIAADLRPLVLDDLGLAEALEWLVSNFMQRHDIPCRLSVPEGIDLQEPYATAVFRIIQESLTNVAKHAEATQVMVNLYRLPDAIALSVEDNGKGFVASQPRKGHSLGLLGVRERARLLGGHATITSTPGEGTRLEVHIPTTPTGPAAAAWQQERP